MEKENSVKDKKLCSGGIEGLDEPPSTVPLARANWFPAWVVAAWSEVFRYSVRILACVQLSVRVYQRTRERERG